jgi:alkylation response protein AidB-like acyl-CoA dehydrogenase
VTTYAEVDSQPKRLEVAREVGLILNRDAFVAAGLGTLTDDGVAALLQSGLMKMGVAAEAGGEQCNYAEWAEVIEELARADGAGAWCLMATSSHAAAFSAVLPDDGVEKLYSVAVPVIAGMPAPRGRADKVEGGYMFAGKHQFASGSALADHFVAGGLVFNDGELVMAENGVPEMVAVIVPKDQVRQKGNWDVNGLEATASIDYEVGPMFVPDEYIVQVNPWVSKVYRGTSFWALPGRPRRIPAGAARDLRTRADAQASRRAVRGGRRPAAFSTRAGLPLRRASGCSPALLRPAEAARRLDAQQRQAGAARARGSDQVRGPLRPRRRDPRPQVRCHRPGLP